MEAAVTLIKRSDAVSFSCQMGAQSSSFINGISSIHETVYCIA